jgi:hypothetical protein
MIYKKNHILICRQLFEKDNTFGRDKIEWRSKYSVSDYRRLCKKAYGRSHKA